MKLTQAQTQLLREAITSRFGRCYVTLVSGCGGDGATVKKYKGHRQSDAACKLRDAGYLVFVGHDESRDIRNGWHKVFVTGTWVITDKGKELAATLGLKPL